MAIRINLNIMGFESRIIGGVDREMGFTNSLEFDEEIIRPIRQNEVKPADFITSGLMTRGEVAADNQEVEKIKKSPDFIREKKSEANSLEYALFKLFDDGAFGDTVKFVKKTTTYDDFIRGVDFYVDIGDDEPVLIGIDATTSTDLKVLKKKVERNVNAAKRSMMPAVKYFVDIDDEQRRDKEMPRVILGVDAATTGMLQSALLRDPDAVEKTPLVSLLIGQMLSQLELIKQAAPPGSKTEKFYDKAIVRVIEMCKEKDLQPEDLEQALVGDTLANPESLFSEPTQESAEPVEIPPHQEAAA